MDWTRVDKAGWPQLFEMISREAEGVQTEIEVVGLDLGAQVEADWVPLGGITYEAGRDTLYLYMTGVKHAIEHPQEIWLQLGPEGLDAFTILDHDGDKEFVRFRRPLKLPRGFKAA